MTPAHRTPTLGVDRPLVVTVTSILNPNDAVPGKKSTIAGIPGRQNTIKHIDALTDSMDQIQRRSYPHEIARFRRRQFGRESFKKLTHQQPWLSDTEAPKRNAGKIQGLNPLKTFQSQIGKDTALDDAEQSLTTVPKRGLAAIGPTH